MELKTYHIKQDNKDIIDLYINTFTQASNKTEGERIGQLVEHIFQTSKTQDIHAFTASNNKCFIGCIIFTPLNLTNARSTYLLSPVAVQSQHQKQGIGKKLIQFGLEELKHKGTEWVMTYGDPEYYSQFGFSWISEKTIIPPFPLSQPMGWLLLPLTNKKLPTDATKATCIAPFNIKELW